MHPWFDRWVLKQLQPGDHIISSYGYANECFKWVRQHGGKTFLDGGNSHPDNFWTILAEEHRRWKCPYPPMPRHHYQRSVAMMEHVDYVLAASKFVAQSFSERGFKPEQLLPHLRPVKLSVFKPAAGERPKNRPLTLISTGALCLRKGSPYLLEAVRLIQKRIPGVRLLLRKIIHSDIKPILAKYDDLPITWLGYVPYHELAKPLQQSDIFILPSLEDGLALTVLEALACGLPAVTTPNTGASDYIQAGVNGEVVPIRDPQAIAETVFKWAEKILAPGWQPRIQTNLEPLSFEHFEKTFIGQLRALGMVS
jgi:glycosyltransferase involved in cell wall biosynthesis